MPEGPEDRDKAFQVEKNHEPAGQEAGHVGQVDDRFADNGEAVEEATDAVSDDQGNEKRRVRDGQCRQDDAR